MSSITGWSLRRHWRWYAGGFVLLMLFLTLLDYQVGIRSEPMALAKKRLEESPSIGSEVGTPVSVGLCKFWGYSYRSGYGNSEARLCLIVSGPDGTRQLTVHLHQIQYEWKIVKSTIPL